MSFSLKFKKLLLVLILFFLSYIAAIDAFNLAAHRSLLSNADGMKKDMKDLVKSGKPKELFKRVSAVIKRLGPLKMSISALISNFTMVSKPKEESEELKAINAGFEKLNDRLDALTTKLGNLDNIVEFSNARAAYVQIVTTINHLYESLEETKQENTKESYAFFGKQYEKTYKFAASNLYDALSGSTGPFGFNLISLYKEHVKCNPVLISEFCFMGVHLINKGLSIEGAYLGYIDFNAKIETKMETWEIKLDEITKHCESIIDVCENSWKEYAYRQFRETHDQISGDNQVFAEKLAKDLNNVVPHRSWLAVAYNDASGFAAHCYSSYYEAEKIWDKKDHDVTIFSVQKEDGLVDENYKKFVDFIEKQKTFVSEMENCNRKYLWLTKRASGDTARIMVEKIREQFIEGVLYVVNMSFKPGQSATGNTIYVSEQSWNCGSSKLRVIAFK